jgi:hypothetical protein
MRPGVLLSLLLIASGCSNLVPFTEKLREQYGIDDAAALSLQFYVDGDLVLEREVQTPASQIKHGKIVGFSGKYVNQVAVDHLTPGVATVVSGNVALVSFDPGSNSTLEFRRYRSFYCFCPWNPNTDAIQQPRPTVLYDGEEYTVAVNVSRDKPKVDEQPGVCFLLVDLDQLAEGQKKRTTLPGRKLGD